MRLMKILFLSFIIMVLLPAVSFSGLRLTLKNGRTIIADGCKEAGSKLICEKMGGTFELDKQDILRSEVADVEARSFYEAPEQVPVPGTAEEKPDTGISESGKEELPKPEGEILLRGADPEAAKRLDEINVRKTELKPMRENLIKEREQLHADVRDAGMIKTQEEYDAIVKRISELEERIVRFNEEVKVLNEEEQEIINELKPGGNTM